MPYSLAAKFVLPAALAIGVCVTTAPSAHAAKPYCPDPSHQKPSPVPPHLVGRVAKALQIDPKLARGNSFVRCAGPTLTACTIGANLVCGKADTRRAIPGATAWCREHPGSQFIPMSATGHATIYDWSCAGRRAVAGKVAQPVDRRGYIAGNWKKVP